MRTLKKESPKITNKCPFLELYGFFQENDFSLNLLP